MKISICIPTYNRSKHLQNCLHSIFSNQSISEIEFEVCVSDNCSTDNTEEVVQAISKKYPIKYNRNPSNLGIPRNFLKVVSMAEGEFVWLIGDDDLLLPNALEQLNGLINRYKDVDFFFINSYHLYADYVFSFPQPFDLANLPQKMIPFSSWEISKELKFFELIDYRISFDFLAGMYLSVFRRENWILNVDALDKNAINDKRTFSHFDNTYPHVKIFSRAFAKSNAYLHAQPLSICLSGAREWVAMGTFVHSVRLVEVLEEYRKNGMPLWQFIKNKNYTLNRFLPHFFLMLYHKKTSGFEYINPWKLLLNNCLYPNFYLSLPYYFIRKIKNLFSPVKSSEKEN